MKRLATFSTGCLVLFAGCARVEIPQFTSVTCSADPIGPPVTSVRKIEVLSKVLRTLPGGWKQVRDESVKVGLAVILKRDSHAVAQIVIGEDWLSIQVADDRGPRINAPIFTKHITAGDREQISLLATEKPNPESSVSAQPETGHLNQSSQPTATTVTPPAGQESRRP